jgi:two-component system chemotaxis response regulator CheY
VTPSKSEPRRVLLVEDDRDQRSLIAWMLRAEGCEVVEAETGIELLDWIGMTSTPRSKGFDAIVSDVNMPDLTAIEVLAAWRYGGWPAPLILVTASDDPNLHIDAYALGVVRVLTKPIGREELRDALARALERPPTRRDAG